MLDHERLRLLQLARAIDLIAEGGEVLPHGKEDGFLIVDQEQAMPGRQLARIRTLGLGLHGRESGNVRAITGTLNARGLRGQRGDGSGSRTGPSSFWTACGRMPS